MTEFTTEDLRRKARRSIPECELSKLLLWAASKIDAQATANKILGDTIGTLAGRILDLERQAEISDYTIQELADEVVELTPPLRSELVAHLEAGGKVEYYTYVGWKGGEFPPGSHRSIIDERGDGPLYGYRLVPIPDTLTIEVPRGAAQAFIDGEDDVPLSGIILNALANS